MPRACSLRRIVERESSLKQHLKILVVEDCEDDAILVVSALREHGYEIEEVIVGEDDLFPSLEDADPHRFNDYIDMCFKRNTHGVPRDVIEKMARSFQK